MKKKSVERRYVLIGVCFLLPAVAAYLVFMAYPLCRTAYLSFSSWSGFGEVVLNGVKNYQDLFADKTFWSSLGNTLYFAVFSGIISVVLGVLTAWLILYMRKMEGQVFRAVLFAPNMIAPTITGLLFLFVFTEDIGLLNNILKAVGLEEWTTAWLANMNTVKPTVVIVQTWRQFGLTMILCFAGLQGISNELIESARLDGAGTLQVMVKVLLPCGKSGVSTLIILTLIESWNMVEQPLIYLKDGGSYPLSVFLASRYTENLPLQFVCCVLSLLPLALCFLLLRRRCVGQWDSQGGEGMKPVILKVSFALLLVLALCTVASYHIERIMMAKGNGIPASGRHCPRRPLRGHGAPPLKPHHAGWQHGSVHHRLCGGGRSGKRCGPIRASYCAGTGSAELFLWGFAGFPGVRRILQPASERWGGGCHPMQKMASVRGCSS